jgi:heme exporter protein C
MEDHEVNRRPLWFAAEMLCMGLLAGAIVGGMWFVPTESTMGTCQRIVYVHVSVAWLSLAGVVVMSVCGILYLRSRRLEWDHWSQAAAELGWLCSSLTLLTGSLWAQSAWGTWWVWEPRLASAFVLWSLYSGSLILRASLHDRAVRARISAVMALLALLDAPMVLFATRWFRGIHPVAPEMDRVMQAVLAVSICGYSAFFGVLFLRRRAQLQLEAMLADRAADCPPF